MIRVEIKIKIKMTTASRQQERIINAYKTPGHPAAFSAPGNVARIFHITKDRAEEILEHVDSRTLHREYHRPPVYNPYYVFKRREQVQGDLIDMQALASKNDGVKYILLLIDVFTKKVWMYPMKDKSALSAQSAINSWISDLDVHPDILKTDRGTEFTNNIVQRLLRNADIEWQPAGGTVKAAVAERANRTLKTMIFTYLSENERLRYVDDLANFNKSYNTKPHRSLKWITPKIADKPRHQATIKAIHMARYAKIEAKRQRVIKLKLGNTVRVKTQASGVSSSRRAYAEQFHGEYYSITRVNRSMPIPMFYVKSLDTGEHIAEGFYAQELQRVRGNSFKIERTIAERTRRGIPEILVKWMYYGDRHNEWIPVSNVVENYNSGNE